MDSVVLERSAILAPHTLPSLTLTQRQVCDLELILNGGFHPLTGFMCQADYDSVLESMRLADGSLWPMPITLDVDYDWLEKNQPGDVIALRDPEGLLIATMTIRSMWEADKEKEALKAFGTTDSTHPAVNYLYTQVKPVYIGGECTKVALPHHYDFTHLRYTPAELRERFQQRGWEKVVAFQTRNPMHRAHQELTLRAHKQTGAAILIHPVVGMTKPGDIDYYLRVRCYEHVLKTYEPGIACLSLLPLAMRMAGPREALWHALIRKNYGCTHFIVGRDHAGPGKNQAGQLFYDPYAAQQLTLNHQDEMGIRIIPFQEMVYSKTQKKYFSVDELPVGDEVGNISGTELRERLQKNQEIPEWFSYPAVIDCLQRANPPKHKQGMTIFLTGLPSSGKSTIANALALKLRELTERAITMLDGDIIRTHLSKGLGFSREDREENITRVGFVAKEVTRHGGIAICALVAPFLSARHKVRQMVSEVGGFVEVYVDTPLTVCETRDRKGMYKQAREGTIKQFTGVSDPYEAPTAAEISIDTVDRNPQTVVDDVIKALTALGYIQ